MASIRLTRYEAQEGQLPAVCMVCGQRAERFTGKTMYWHPPWVFVLLLLGLLPFIIAALLTQQRLRLKAPLCANHLNHWQARSLAIWLSLLGFVVVGIGGSFILLQMQPPGRRDEDAIMGFVCIGGLVLLVIWLVLVAVLQSTAVRPKEIGDRYIISTGVAPASLMPWTTRSIFLIGKRMITRRTGRPGDAGRLRYRRNQIITRRTGPEGVRRPRKLSRIGISS